MALKVASCEKKRCFKYRSEKLINASLCRSLKTMTARPVNSKYELQQALDLRWAGYKKYGILRHEADDAFDHLDSTAIFNAYNKHGDIVGTIRVVKQGEKGMEIEKYLQLDNFDFCHQSQLAEASRFSVSCRVNPVQVKILLWKTVLLYCRQQGIDNLLIWVRKGAMRDYLQLLYKSTGIEGQFNHRTFDNRPHQLMYCNIKTLEQLFRQAKHPLHDYFFA